MLKGEVKKGNKMLPFLLFCFLVSLILAVLSVIVFTPAAPKVTVERIVLPDEINPIIPAQHRATVAVIIQKNAELSIRKRYLHALLAENSNGDYVELLIYLAQGKAGIDIAQEAQSILGNEIRDQKLNIYHDIYKNYLKETRLDTNGNPRNDNAIEKKLRFLIEIARQTAPFDERRALLEQISVDEPILAEKMALALSVEGNAQRGFESLLKRLYAKYHSLNEGSVEAKQIEISEIIAGRPDLLALLEGHLREALTSLNDKELKTWCLQLALLGRSTSFNDFLDEMQRRGLVTGYNRAFWDTLLRGDSSNLPGYAKESLLRGSFGELEKKDIVAMANWLSIEVEKPLLAMLIIAESADLKREAFDTLAVRATLAEPTRSLVQWVKAKRWNERENLAWPIGVLGLGEYASDVDITKALDLLMPYAGSGSLLRYVMESKQERLLALTLDRVVAITEIDLLFQLLRHKNKEVRIAATKGFDTINDIVLLQSLKKAYNAEKDPEVRAAYEASGQWIFKGNQ